MLFLREETEAVCRMKSRGLLVVCYREKRRTYTWSGGIAKTWSWSTGTAWYTMLRMGRWC